MFSDRTRFSAAELLAESFPEPDWVLPGLLPLGLTLMLGPTTLDKTALALGLALAVSSGTPILDMAPAAPSAVLYIALEENPRLLQHRLRAMLSNGTSPGTLDPWTDCPALDAGGMRDLVAWVRERHDPRLIAIDAMPGIMPSTFARLPAHDREGATLAAFALLARRLQVAVLVLHHRHVARAEDINSVLSGRSALSRAADAVLILEPSRGHQHAILHVAGPGVLPHRLGLAWDSTTRSWIEAGLPAEPPLSETRQAILSALRSAPGPLQPRDIAAATGLNSVTVRGHLRKMARAGQVLSHGPGRYALPGRTQ